VQYVLRGAERRLPRLRVMQRDVLADYNVIHDARSSLPSLPVA
jgi:hypothetical protein